MSIKDHWALILIGIFLLSILYPISVIASYSGVEGQVFQPNLKHDKAELSSNMYPENDTTVKVWDVNWSPLSTNNQTQYASSKIDVFDLTIKFAETTPFRVLLENNGTFTDYAVLNAMNITFSLNIKSLSSSYVKVFNDTFTLNSETTNLVITKNYTWKPPRPSFFSAINPSSENSYQLDYQIQKDYFYSNETSSTLLTGMNGIITVKSVNLIPVAIIYTVFILLIAIAVFVVYYKKIKV